MKGRVEFREEVRTADVVIVGGGVAGMTAALHAAGRKVVMLGKTAFAAGGSSVHAQGGIAAAIGGDDSPSHHAEDTIAAGAGLCDSEVVRRVTSEGPRRIAELVERGAVFDRRPDGGFALGREGAHSRSRVAHAAGDATGRELVRALASSVRSAPNIDIVEHVLALDLIKLQGRVAGVLAVDRTGRSVVFAAPEVVLATGGVGQLWERSTNPGEATGDGLAMAVRAGAVVADIEFVQFHPTALAVKAARLPLLTEALRGEGAVLVDAAGRRFMVDEHPEAELAPRDVVARAIWRRLNRGDEVFLDATCIRDRVTSRFPTVAGLCSQHGFDLANDRVPVTPAAHYHMGGVVVDSAGRTTVPGLWACGEVARTGLHGANRLASNSLLEAVVLGASVGEALAGGRSVPVHPVRLRDAVARAEVPVAPNPWLAAASEDERAAEAGLRSLMWRCAGLERDAAGLHRAAGEVAEIAHSLAPGRSELHNMVEVAGLVIRAASARTESRGAHHRTDFPSPSRCWLQPLLFQGSRMLNPRPVIAATASG